MRHIRFKVSVNLRKCEKYGTNPLKFSLKRTQMLNNTLTFQYFENSTIPKSIMIWQIAAILTAL